MNSAGHTCSEAIIGFEKKKHTHRLIKHLINSAANTGAWIQSVGTTASCAVYGYEQCQTYVKWGKYYCVCWKAWRLTRHILSYLYKHRGRNSGSRKSNITCNVWIWTVLDMLEVRGRLLCLRKTTETYWTPSTIFLQAWEHLFGH